MAAFEDALPAAADDAHQQIFRTLEIGLVRINVEGYFLEVNDAFAGLVRQAADTMVGQHIADVLHPDDLATCLAQMDAALAGNPRPIVVSVRVVQPDGALVRVRAQGILSRDAHGHPQQFIAMVQPEGAAPPEPSHPPGFDVIAGMGHALRTPLNAMLGFAQLLRVDPTQPLSAGQLNKIHHIEEAGAQLLALLSDVIDLARLETQRLPLQIQPWPLAPLLDEVLALVAEPADTAGVRLHRQPCDEALCVWADRDRLRQILLRLLQHALRTPQAGGRVLLEAQALNHHVAITVSDTWHTLSADQQAELFAMPRPGQTHAPGDGTFLGLHVAKRLVELMRGRIEVSSAPGLGTRLHLWLPQGQTSQPAAEEPPPPRSAFAELDGQAGDQPLTVLYAEDNVVNIELVRQVIRMRPQWRLEVAYCGQDAITMALRDPPHLLLLDMHLGDMSGLDVSNVLARQAYTAHIPRVALSADVLPQHINEARAQGFADYLTKPLDVGRLLRLLDRVAQRVANAGEA